LSKKAAAKPKREPEKAPQKRAAAPESELLARALKEIQQMSYVTPYLLSTKLEVKVGVAKRILKQLEREGKLRLVSPSRRSPLYVPAAG